MRSGDIQYLSMFKPLPNSLIRSQTSSDDTMKAMGMDLVVWFVARSMPVSFTLPTSSELIWDLITRLFDTRAFASRTEEAYVGGIFYQQNPLHLLVRSCLLMGWTIGHLNLMKHQVKNNQDPSEP